MKDRLGGEAVSMAFARRSPPYDCATDYQE